MRIVFGDFDVVFSAINRWLIVALFFLLTIVATAQDRRALQPSELQIEMPVEIRIQAAAHIGDTTLLVWGYSIATSDSIVPMLAMVADEGKPGGGVGALTSLDARPFDHLVVLPFVDRFLVLWSDRRTDAPGIYYAVVSPKARILVQPRRIGPGMLSRDSIRDAAIIGYPGHTALLVWNATNQGDSRAYCLNIDSLGASVGTSVKLAGKFMRAATFGSNDPRVMLLLDSSAKVVDPNGELESGTIAAPIWRSPFFMRPDGSLVVLDRDSLRFYRGIFESSPYRSAFVKSPASPVEGVTTIAPLDDRTIAIDYQTLQVEFNDWGIVALVRSKIDTAGSVLSAARPIDSVSILPLLTEDRFVSVSPLKLYLAPNCDGRQTSVMTIKADEAYFRGNGMYYTEYYTVNHDAGSDSLGITVGTRSESLNQCGIFARSTLWPLRTAWIGMSEVALVIGNDTVRHGILSGEGMQVLPERQPYLSRRGDTVLMAWQQERPSVSFRLGRWDDREQRFVLIDSLTPDSLRAPSGHSEFFDIVLESLYDNADLVGQGNQIAVIDRQNRTDIISLNMGAAHEEYYSTRFRVFQALSSGWKNVKTLYDESYDHWVLLTFDQWSIGAEPDEHTLGVVTGGFVGGFDSYGNQLWQFDTLPSLSDQISAFLPVDNQKFYVASNSRLWKITSWQATALASFSIPSAAATFQQLKGGRILRMLPLDSARRQLSLEIYDSSGYAIAKRDLIFDNPASTVSIDEGETGMIAVVVSGSGGVRATLFSPALDIMAYQQTISSTRDSTGHVAAIIAGDSLIAVWEDFREGRPALYSAALLHLSRFAGVTDNSGENNPAAFAIAVAPNPVHDQIQLHIDGGDAIEEISLWDALGREIMHRTPATTVSEMSLDAHSLSSGLYHLRVRSSRNGLRIVPVLVAR